MRADLINCLVIDDDEFIQDLLSDKLEVHFPELQILAKAKSGSEGIEAISNHKPQLIFLDVEMLDMTGFEMLSKIDAIDFEVIFITSYSHYAIKAIRFNALDYLIKPIDLGELKKSIQRFKTRTSKNLGRAKVQTAIQNLASENHQDQKLILQTQEGELFFSLKDIVRIEGERNYSYIHLANNKKKLVSKTLLDLENLLDDKGFFRCHKSHIINRNYIMEGPNRIHIKLRDELVVPLSRRKKEAFKVWMESHHS